MKQHMKKLAVILAALLLVLLCVLVALSVKNRPTASDENLVPEETQEVNSTEPTGVTLETGKETEATQPENISVEESEERNPWDEPGAKRPEDYTLADYEALTETQKMAFCEYLGPEGLEAWLRKVYDKDSEYPWDKPGAKQPKDYTWEEFQALTSAQQIAFMEHMGPTEFQKWKEKNQVIKQGNPWDKPGAKQPQDYTWEEYERLTDAQKKAFRDFLGTSRYEAWLARVQKEGNPWEKPGAKQPDDYTWQEYEALSDAQKVAFQEHLGAEGFKAWMQWALDGGKPWDKPNAKQPKDYTWAEYQNLTEEQKVAFESDLGSAEFQAWLARVANIPWNQSGAKQPKDYTWAEYEALNDAQKLAFRSHLGVTGFEEWKTNAQNPKKEYPWDKPGAKQPKDYTKAEFEALTAEQQMAFQKHLGEAGFAAWLEKVDNQNPAEKNPWDEPGAKQPKDYTKAEFEALTAEQQMAFQKHLGEAGFAAWLEKVDKVEKPVGENPWDTPGAKQPEDYTLAEFEALTAEQQMAFQKHLGEEGFAAWLDKVENPAEKNPWDAPGAKQPKDYTMEEFEALSPAQQMAFQKHLGEAGFEEWLNRVAG